MGYCIETCWGKFDILFTFAGDTDTFELSGITVGEVSLLTTLFCLPARFFYAGVCFAVVYAAAAGFFTVAAALPDPCILSLTIAEAWDDSFADSLAFLASLRCYFV